MNIFITESTLREIEVEGRRKNERGNKIFDKEIDTEYRVLYKVYKIKCKKENQRNRILYKNMGLFKGPL